MELERLFGWNMVPMASIGIEPMTHQNKKATP